MMQRIGFLDGLRGLACMQVVLFHYGSAFCPNARLGVLANGVLAVAIFFVISGFVLTESFARAPGAIAGHLSRRALRLALPAAVSILFAALLWRCDAGVAARAAWLNHDGPWALMFSLPGAAGLAWDLTGWPILLGDPALRALHIGLPAYAVTSLNPPLWSISAEFYGSIWVVGLVALRALARPAYWAALLASLYVIGAGDLWLFTAGHLCAELPRRGGRWLPVAGWLALGLAMALLTGLAPQWAVVLPAGRLGAAMALPPGTELAAALIFIGVLLVPGLRELLAKPAPLFLGRRAFSIYLLHWPIMASAGSLVFLGMRPFGAALAACLALAVGLALTFAGAGLFEAAVDQPAVRLSRRIMSGPAPAARRARVVPP